jgi:hypothetical protein
MTNWPALPEPPVTTMWPILVIASGRHGLGGWNLRLRDALFDFGVFGMNMLSEHLFRD